MGTKFQCCHIFSDGIKGMVGFILQSSHLFIAALVLALELQVHAFFQAGRKIQVAANGKYILSLQYHFKLILRTGFS